MGHDYHENDDADGDYSSIMRGGNKLLNIHDDHNKITRGGSIPIHI